MHCLRLQFYSSIVAIGDVKTHFASMDTRSYIHSFEFRIVPTRAIEFAKSVVQALARIKFILDLGLKNARPPESRRDRYIKSKYLRKYLLRRDDANLKLLTIPPVRT